MNLSRLELYQSKEHPKIFRDLQQFYLADLHDNVSCFKAIYEAAPERFGKVNPTGESPLQTLKRSIFINKQFLTALNIPQHISQRLLRHKSVEELVEIFEKQANAIHSRFENDPTLFEFLIHSPIVNYPELVLKRLELTLPNLLNNPTLFNFPETTGSGFEFLLDADGQLAANTGALLKHIDAIRSEGFSVERPIDLSWGPEGKKQIVPEGEHELADQTRSLLSQPMPVVIKQLKDQLASLDMGFEGVYIGKYDELPNITDKLLEIILRHTRDAALENHEMYEHLANFTEWGKTVGEGDKAIGNGSTPTDDLRHEVINIFKRISVLSDDKSKIPPEEDLIGLNTEELLNIYLKGAYMLIERFTDPSVSSKTFDWWGPKTGTELLLSAYRHFKQHGGTLDAHYRARKDFLY